MTASGSTTKSFDDNGNPSADSVTANQITYDGTLTYTYDDAGERTTKYDSTEKWTYSYNNAGQLTEVDIYSISGGTPTLTATIDYTNDVFGNLLSRTETDYSGGSSTTSTEEYAYDGWKTNLDSQGNAPNYVGSENFDAWATLNSSSVLTARWVFGNSSNSVAALITADGRSARSTSRITTPIIKARRRHRHVRRGRARPDHLRRLPENHLRIDPRLQGRLLRTRNAP